MPQTTQIEIWVVVDAGGDYEVAPTEDGALDAFNDNIGGNSARRLVKLVLTVPLPEPLVVTGTIPAPVEPGCELQVV